MNVIVSNKYQTLLGTLNIDVIESINGEFSVEDLVNQFSNYFYNKMIIDVTAIKNYKDINTMRDIAINFDPNKIILVLDDSDIVNAPGYLSQLVSIGIYNFTRDVNNIPFLIDNPNTYKDVVGYQNLNESSSSTKMKSSMKNIEEEKENYQRIIGIKNITDHAGATTLCYMMKKQLEKYYRVKAIEINSTDFEYFNDKTLESVDFMNASQKISNYSDKEVILIDLNDSDISLCTDILYLIEPGIIKLNKLIRHDNKIFEKLNDKKIVLNKSVLNELDLKDFEYESGSKVFYNLPYLDEKLENNEVINKFLLALGFSKMKK